MKDTTNEVIRQKLTQAFYEAFKKFKEMGHSLKELDWFKREDEKEQPKHKE